MVVKGNFQVQLVEAVSGQPFKEHSLTGKPDECFAEVEPGAEYFIRVQYLAKDDDDFFGSGSVFVADLEVDGCDLGYELTIEDDTAHLCGGWKHEKGKSGSLNARSEGIPKKALVRSGQGSTLCTVEESLHTVVHEREETAFESLTLHYCTVLGLVEAGVFKVSKAKMWECARLRFPVKKQPEPWLRNVQPEMHSRDAIIKDGVVFEPSKRWELLDLTVAGVDSNDED
ncbi:expressed unknown protein [Seminavis robusta]|uniref:Uncharacterized protein n=1 Tax=Seminavis robusta TaxID=568900 RepID=A0A9N8HZL4_9STRA|nr:expressed unknown protein [Seminavis robusta]|eukprot:Sro3798_g351150.1 n/a (228) ;mRNA; r:3198-4047